MAGLSILEKQLGYTKLLASEIVGINLHTTKEKSDLKGKHYSLETRMSIKLI